MHIGVLVDYVQGMETFKKVSKSIVDECVYKLKPLMFTKGQSIVSKGSKPQEAFIILEGEVLKTKESKCLLLDPTASILKAKDLIGFEHLEQEQRGTSDWNYFCLSPEVKCLSLHLVDFKLISQKF